MANGSDDVELPDRGYNTDDLRTVGTKPRRRRWGLWALAILLLGPALVFAAWAAITLGFSYSRGERGPGVVQKFSRKGWVCKTWEGELAMVPAAFGVPSEPFQFTVRDDSVAEVINRLMRQGARVTLRYAQHRGVPTTCFGETEYYVNGVEVIAGQGTTPGAAPGPGPAPAAGTPGAPVPQGPTGPGPGAVVQPAPQPAPQPTPTPPATPAPPARTPR